MYPQQPGQQPPYPPQQGPTPLPPEQPTQPQSTAPIDPWQLQQPQAQPQAQPTEPSPQPSSPQAAPSTWAPQPTGTYNEVQVPLVPEGVAPIDYLDQIAPKPKASFGFSRKQVAIIGSVILVAFLGVAAAAIFKSSRPDISAQSQQVLTGVSITGTLTKNAQKNLRSRELSVLNSNVSIQLSNASTGLTKAFTDAGIDLSEMKLAKEDETSADTVSKLEDARLNGVFDRVYAREMSFRLTTIMTQLDSIHQTTNNETLRDYLESTYKNLEPFQKQLEEYNAAAG